MSVINTNVKSLIAQNALTVNNRSLSQAMQQLSTGKRINSAKDDAAGMAVSNVMTAQIRGLNQAVRNANDATSMLQTAEGAMVEQTNMMQRMRELSVQASNDTLTDDQRTYLDKEFQDLLAQIDEIGGQTTWNGENILDATGGDGSGKYTFQVGASADQKLEVEILDMSSGGELSALASQDLTSRANANTAITQIDTALAAMNDQRAELGSKMSRLTYTADTLSNIATNTSESRSRIEDTDYATATTELARTQIIQQAATAMLAQANQSSQSVLALLK